MRTIINQDPPNYEAIRGINFYSFGQGKPMPIWTTRITEAGRKLIKNGAAQVEVRASCK